MQYVAFFSDQGRGLAFSYLWEFEELNEGHVECTCGHLVEKVRNGIILHKGFETSGLLPAVNCEAGIHVTDLAYLCFHMCVQKAVRKIVFNQY
jgi:hypothetical protein